MKKLDPNLKLCPSCHTMKLFNTDICYRCLDRKEAMREVKIELEKKLLHQKECIFLEIQKEFIKKVLTDL